MASNDDVPFGWRPYTEEQSNALRATGMSEDQIKDMERSNVYSPAPASIRAEYMAISLIEVLTERLGTSFARQVLERIEQKAERLSEGELEDRVEAPMVAQIKEYGFWKKIGGVDQ